MLETKENLYVLFFPSFLLLLLFAFVVRSAPCIMYFMCVYLGGEQQTEQTVMLAQSPQTNIQSAQCIENPPYADVR